MVAKTTLAALPDIEGLLKLTQSLAMPDEIMSPEWEYRYYSFNSKWDEGEMMASMRNGSGDEYFILFMASGFALKVGNSVQPPCSLCFSGEFCCEMVTTETQRAPRQHREIIRPGTFEAKPWQVGIINYPDEDDPDGSEYMLSILDGRPSTYKEFAESYYEKPLDLGAIELIYRHEPLTNEIVARLNAEISLEALIADVEQISYPKLIDHGDEISNN
jgi:hypothetical protein